MLFIASYLQVVFLVFRDYFYLRFSLVNGYYVIPQLLFTQEDLKHYLEV